MLTAAIVAVFVIGAFYSWLAIMHADHDVDPVQWLQDLDRPARVRRHPVLHSTSEREGGRDA